MPGRRAETRPIPIPSGQAQVREHLASYVPQLFPELGRTPAVPPGVSRQFFDWKQKAILGVGWVLLGFLCLGSVHNPLVHIRSTLAEHDGSHRRSVFWLGIRAVHFRKPRVHRPPPYRLRFSRPIIRVGTMGPSGYRLSCNREQPGDEPQAMIQLNGVVKRYSGRTVLAGITFCVRPERSPPSSGQALAERAPY